MHADKKSSDPFTLVIVAYYNDCFHNTIYSSDL